MGGGYWVDRAGVKRHCTVRYCTTLESFRLFRVSPMKMYVLTTLLGLAALTAAQNCQILIPPDALSSQGLATPFCTRFNATSNAGCVISAANNFGALAFVHGVILNLQDGAISVYNPLVINCGTVPAIFPTKPVLPVQNVVALWFGYNGGALTLTDTPGTTSTAQANCVNGLNINGQLDTFLQFAYCNAPAFLGAAQTLILQGKITVPPLGTAVDGVLCPNIRAFDVVDQDQSDNVPTQYLIDGMTQLLAQFSQANLKALNTPTVLANPSDNIVATSFIMPAVGCATSVWRVPNLADNGALVAAQPLNEIQAHYFALKPQALCPINHAFTLTNVVNAGTQSAPKTNLYRVAVFQPLISETLTQPNGQANALQYCKNLNNIVGLWFGFNGAQLVLQNSAGGNGLTSGNCVNGFGGTVFGEFAYCNAPAFFDAANNAIVNGSLIIPPLATASDGKPCPTVRDFTVIDQDQSDNVLSQYLQVTVNGVTKFAQDIPANRNLFPNFQLVANPSDNRLVDLFIDPALGCSAWMVPDAADPAGAQMVASLPMNEIFAAYRQPAPQALVPVNDPMVLLEGASSVDKVNLYRAGVFQPQVAQITQANAMTYCQMFASTAFNRLQGNMAALQKFASPDGNAKSNLYNFLVNVRFTTSFGPQAQGGLGCTTMGLANPFLAASQNSTVLSRTLIVVLASTGGALAVLGVGAAACIVYRRKRETAIASSNFMAL